MIRITIDVNGDVIGEIVATAQDACRDNEQLYIVNSTVDKHISDGEWLGVNDLGRIWHNPADGAMPLLEQMLNLADERDLVSEEERLE